MAGPPEPSERLDTLIQQLAAEPHPLKRRQLLLAARDCWQPDTVQRLYDEVVRLSRVDIGRTERLARSAAWLGERVEDDAARALGLRALGHMHLIKGKYEAAREAYAKAAEIFERLGRELDLGRTLSGGSLQALIYLGRYDEAFAWAEKARNIFLKTNERLHLARLDTNMGNVLFRLDRFEEALELYRRAYAELVEIGNPQDVAITLSSMATCQISLSQFREALDTYNLAQSYCLTHHLPLLGAEADYNIAYLYYLRGEYTSAIARYRAAREQCSELGDLYHQGLCDLDQSEMYLELNLSEEGAHLARRALEAFVQLGMGYETAKAVTNLAISASHHGDSRVALELFRRAREIFTRERNQAWVATVDLYQALVYHQTGRLTEARLLSESAFAFFSQSPVMGKAILCQLLLARIYLDAGQRQKARETCRTALGRLESAETPALAYQAWFVLGTIEEACGARAAAFEAYLKAHEQLENLRSQLKAEELKIAFLKDKLEVYESLVRMCLARGDAPENREAAFAYIEQAKSRSLADLIAFRVHTIPASSAQHRALAAEAGRLREELNWYNRSIQLQESRSRTPRDPYLEKLRRSARNCEQRLVEIMANLRAADQEFANVQAAGSIGLEQIRSALADDAMLLQYYRVGDAFQACLLGKRKLKIVPAGSVSHLRRALMLLRFQLSKFRLGPEFVRTFEQQLLEATNAHLQEFYRQLILPIERDLDTAHLIVAPHDFLHYLPFHALLDRGEYLDARYSISYTPSASVYYLCASKEAPSGAGALVLGVPDRSAPHIMDEVAAVSSVLPKAQVFVGAEATQEVLRLKGSRSRFIHIATHGWFRQDNPMFSSISLGNSQLSLFDLYQLTLPSELVTLSGCGTGLNVVVGGDEQMGLKRGLLYAGAQGVLVTLWDVNDQSTAEFMKLFYEHLRAGMNKAQAVRQAMAEIRRQYAHPFYWAPFILVGKYS